MVSLLHRFDVRQLRLKKRHEEERDACDDEEEEDDDAGKRHFVVEQNKLRRIEKQYGKVSIHIIWRHLILTCHIY